MNEKDEISDDLGYVLTGVHVDRVSEILDPKELEQATADHIWGLNSYGDDMLLSVLNQRRNVVIHVPPAELHISGGPVEVRPEPPIEWPEGDLPEQEPRSAENDETIFDEYDDDTLPAALAPPPGMDVPPEFLKDLARKANRELRKMISDEFDRQETAECVAHARRQRLANLASRLLSRVVSDQIGDALERAHGEIENGDSPNGVWSRFICSILIATTHSITHRINAVVMRFAGK